MVAVLVLNVPQHDFPGVRTATRLVIDLETCVGVEDVVEGAQGGVVVVVDVEDVV